VPVLALMSLMQTLANGCAADGAFDDYAWAAYSVLPAQIECGHLQSTSGTSSIASHCGLQYFSEVT
jgi:hypothetical protein